MFKLNQIIILAVLLMVFGLVNNVLAATDADNDKVSDDDEKFVYYTDPNNPDTDNDGYDDYTELTNGFSPHAKGLKMVEYDYDNDGLNDKFERLLGTDLGNPDTDADGYTDGLEFYYGYDPNNSELGVRLKKRIEIGINEQRLKYYIGLMELGEFPVSTGTVQYATPLGSFVVDSKADRAWSARWGLWMPWWMSLKHGYFGIHELPEWPGGVKEGENHLGQRVSHGCIRLGVGSAKLLYDWADLGTSVAIKQSFAN